MNLSVAKGHHPIGEFSRKIVVLSPRDQAFRDGTRRRQALDR
jgi:hypothetical protein